MSSQPVDELSRPASSSSRVSVVDTKPIQTPDPRITALEAKRNNLVSKLADLTTERAALAAEFDPSSHSDSSPSSQVSHKEDAISRRVSDAQHVVRNQIRQLQRYNEIKDIGLGLIGLVAEQRGVRVSTVMAEFGVEAKD